MVSSQSFSFFISKIKRSIFHLSLFMIVGMVSYSSLAAAENKTGRWRGPETEEATVDESASAEEAVTIASGMPAPKTESKKTSSTQKLTVEYIEPEDKEYHDLANVLKESRGIDEIVEALNETYDFPHIEVVFDMCGQDNAFYDNETRRIILCYELVASLAESFREDEELTDDEVGNQVVASLIFTFFHELGHAAVDVFDLPITGNEEDAVDRFATLILLDDEDLADNAIGSFDLDTAESLEDVDFADEHPVNEQRWYTMACLMVGSDPEKYDYLVGEDGLPPARAEGCAVEYAKIKKGWDSLMKVHESKPVLAQKGPVVLVSEREGKQADARDSRKGMNSENVSAGPIISFNKPTYGEEVAKPVTIDISFKPKDAPVDISTLEVTYLKLFSIDITDRVKEYAKPSGIKIENAAFPSGTHKVRFAIKDSEGRLSENTLKVSIKDE